MRVFRNMIAALAGLGCLGVSAFADGVTIAETAGTNNTARVVVLETANTNKEARVAVLETSKTNLLARINVVEVWLTNSVPATPPMYTNDSITGHADGCPTNRCVYNAEGRLYSKTQL